MHYGLSELGDEIETVGLDRGMRCVMRRNDSNMKTAYGDAENYSANSSFLAVSSQDESFVLVGELGGPYRMDHSMNGRGKSLNHKAHEGGLQRAASLPLTSIGFHLACSLTAWLKRLFERTIQMPMPVPSRATIHCTR
jgi:hypothetical protein